MSLLLAPRAIPEVIAPVQEDILGWLPQPGVTVTCLCHLVWVSAFQFQSHVCLRVSVKVSRAADLPFAISVPSQLLGCFVCYCSHGVCFSLVDIVTQYHLRCFLSVWALCFQVLFGALNLVHLSGICSCQAQCDGYLSHVVRGWAPALVQGIL